MTCCVPLLLLLHVHLPINISSCLATFSSSIVLTPTPRLSVNSCSAIPTLSSAVGILFTPPIDIFIYKYL